MITASKRARLKLCFFAGFIAGFFILSLLLVSNGLGSWARVIGSIVVGFVAALRKAYSRLSPSLSDNRCGSFLGMDYHVSVTFDYLRSSSGQLFDPVGRLLFLIFRVNVSTTEYSMV